ncbi:MAG: response regulator [Planctomycetota bacterium]
MNHLVSSHQPPVSTLRITSHEQDKILRLLEADQADSKHASRRESERLAFPPGVGVNATISQPGGTNGHFLVRGLNLSEHGIGIIHGGYVHAGSKALITLVTADGERFSVSGVAKRCEYVTNGVHYVGVAFDSPFDLEGFLNGINDDAGIDTPSLASATRVHGRVLLLDDSDAALRLTAYLVNRIGASVVEARTLEEAKRGLDTKTPDLVISDIWLGVDGLPDFIHELRQIVGAETPIVALSADERNETRERVLEAGCAEVLVKPVSQGDFNECLTRFLPAVEPEDEDDPQRRIVSDLWGDVAMRPLITRFVRDLDAIINQLDTDLRALKTDSGRLGAYNACMQIGADASAYGYPSIQSIGNTMCMLIDGGADTKELQTQLVDLQARAEAAGRGLSFP